MGCSMKFSKEIIIGDEVENKKHTLKLIKKGIYKNKYFFICIDIDSKNLFDIVDSLQICKPYYKTKNYTIVGICKNKEESKLVLKKIIESHIKNGKDIYSLKETLLNV